MDSDDFPRGRVLTRREALAVLGATGAVVLSGGALRGATTSDTTGVVTSCVARPRETQGPYFVDEKLERTDIRSDPSDGTVKAGALLELTFNVSRAVSNGCTPLAGVLVDVWHCDVLGVYSDVSDPGFNTVGKKFLRGYQVTDAIGAARFTTIYPGWYQGRTVHIHFKIRSAPSSGAGFEFTSQLYFDDALTDRVHAQQPYARKGPRARRNAGDGIYRQNGAQLLLVVNRSAAGYAATFGIALQTV
jgi:protocatechuate 3,4-dioxygenase beta subunit